MYSTSQQLTRYYDLYRDIDVTFSKDVIKTLGLQTQQVSLKVEGHEWPCVINSASLVAAKVIAVAKGELISKIQRDTASINIRFSFIESEGKSPVSFFISSKLVGFSAYGDTDDLILIQLQYSQRAPDLLIEKIGFLLDSNANSAKRRDERIPVTDDTMRKIGITKQDAIIYVENVPRRCFLRDISFAGAKAIAFGLAQFVRGKEVVLCIDFNDLVAKLPGKIVRTEDVRGRKDLIAIAVSFFENNIPISYKMHLNSYITTQTKNALERTQIDDDF